MACAHTDDLPVRPPKGIGDKEQYHDTCTWHNLKAVELEVCLRSYCGMRTYISPFRLLFWLYPPQSIPMFLPLTLKTTEYQGDRKWLFSSCR